MPFWIQAPNIISLAEGGSQLYSVAFDPPLSLPDLLEIASGRELTPEQKARIPRILRVRPAQAEHIPDILATGEIGPWIVSQRLRDKIEELEPDIHEFIPVSVRRDDDSRDHGIYHLILLTQSVDAVVAERTKFQEGYGKEAAALSGDLLDSADPDITLKETATAGHHLWRAGVLYEPMWMHYFCSDELARFVMENKLTGWRLTKCNSSSAMRGHSIPRAPSVSGLSRSRKQAGRGTPYWIKSTLKQGVPVVSKEFDPPLPDTSLHRLVHGHLPTPEDRLLPWEVAPKSGRVPTPGIPRLLRVSNPLATRMKEFTRIRDIMGWNIGPWIVSQGIRDKLEQLEPEAHKFVPLEVIHEGGAKHYGTYHVILMTKSLDAVIFEKTRFHEGYGEEAAKASAYSFNAFYPDIHLKRNVIAGHHLWRGDGRMSLSYFCSAAFGDFIIENNMEGWDLTECSVDSGDPI